MQASIHTIYPPERITLTQLKNETAMSPETTEKHMQHAWTQLTPCWAAQHSNHTCGAHQGYSNSNKLDFPRMMVWWKIVCFSHLPPVLLEQGMIK